MRRAFKYRLYPNRHQESILKTWFRLCRELYNAALEERREAWKQSISINYSNQQNQLPEIKKIRPEFAEVHSQVLQNVLVRLKLAFEQFFGRVKRGEKPGYPRFKSRDRYNSVTWPQDPGFSLVGTKRLRLSGIGEIRVKLHRPLEGHPKTCTVKLEAGRWYAVLSCDWVEPRKVLHPMPDSEIGIDVGLESFATTTTGEKVENPRWYRKTEAAIARAQQDVGRKEKGSGNYYKAKKRLGRLHAKAANQRRDFQHKLANRIVSENRLIVVEDLDIREMVGRSSVGISKSIHDAAWGGFLAMLSYKAEEAGRKFVKVPAQGTSSTCFQCGTYKKKALSEREHRCSCGLTLDRDLHASLNILRLGRSLQASA